MSRVRRGFKARRRRNKVLKAAKGFHFDRRTKYRHAKQTLMRALHFAYQGRRLFKRERRALWIQRISAACSLLDTSYSRFMKSLKDKDIGLNRKMLSEMAARDFSGFKSLFEATKS